MERKKHNLFTKISTRADGWVAEGVSLTPEGCALYDTIKKRKEAEILR